MINEDIEHLLEQMTRDLKALLQGLSRADPVMIGIHTGGTWVASYLHRQLQLDDPLGELNIAFYRDDFSRIGMHPRVAPSNLPFEIDNKHIILVDDVLYTGRTIRAALNEIFDYGRPASVTLVVLVERGGRELPVQADIVGKSMTLNDDEHVKLSGPEPLALVIKKSE
jgi:pyrimidine operon attenuation protein/uracil phosphoribosyltransferase